MLGWFNEETARASRAKPWQHFRPANEVLRQHFDCDDAVRQRYRNAP
jgi:hypothetical protein